MEPASTRLTSGSVFVRGPRLCVGVCPSPTPEVSPLPCREAERIGVGVFPQAPTKEGCALSGLSRRRGPGADSFGGFPQPPTEEGRALSGFSRRKGPERTALGGSPKPPPKRAAPSLDSPAGRDPERTALGGIPRAPTEGGCALSGLSRRKGPRRGQLWGVPPSPHQRGLRPLWTLPPEGTRRGQLWRDIPNTSTTEGRALYGFSRRKGSPPRGSGCDVRPVRCFAIISVRTTTSYSMACQSRGKSSDARAVRTEESR